MNNEQLEKKIALLLEVPDEKSEYFFSLFKKKLSEFLTVGEALTIESLGTFQLKEQISHSSETKLLDPSEKALTIIFSPESTEGENDFLFINIELDEKKKDYTEFDENIFELSIGKELATDSSLGSKQEAASQSDDFELRISQLFEKSSKSKDFDLWDDHLKTKEQKSILIGDDETETKNIDDIDAQETEEEFMPLSEDDVFEDIIEDNESEAEELGDNLLDELELEEDEPDLEVVNEPEEDLEVDLQETEEQFENVEDSDPPDETNLITDSPLIDEKEEILEEAEPINNDDDIELKEENIEDAKQEEEIVGPETLNDLNVKLEEENEIEKNEDTPKTIVPEPTESGKSNKLLIYGLVAVFVIIAGISSYYLFFNNSINLADREEAVIDPINSSENETGEIKASQEQENLVSEEIKDDQEEASGRDNQVLSDAATKIPEESEESEVSKNIYFDGKNYSVQVSSWKQRIIAEREESKLSQLGFPTFVQQVYIPKFDGVWNRVRIGPYSTIEEAKEAQLKLNK